jgi:hypothetical protein
MNTGQGNPPQNYHPVFIMPPRMGGYGSSAAAALNLINGILGIILGVIIAFVGLMGYTPGVCICGFMAFIGSSFSFAASYQCFERNSYRSAVVLTVLGMIFSGLTIICFFIGLLAIMILVKSKQDFFNQPLLQMNQYPVMVMPYPVPYPPQQVFVSPPSQAIKDDPTVSQRCPICGVLKSKEVSKCPECGGQAKTVLPISKKESLDEFR